MTLYSVIFFLKTMLLPLSHSVMSTLRPHGLEPAGLLCPWGFSRPKYWNRLPCLSPGDFSNPGIELRSPALQADSLPSEPPGKPKNTEVGSLPLLQGIFPTQESNQGLLPWKQILYQLCYQGNPAKPIIPAWSEKNLRQIPTGRHSQKSSQSSKTKKIWETVPAKRNLRRHNIWI